MTCEISIMNLNAIALAADSAMTVKRWESGKEQTKFFKGSNKIFQLSNHHPIGLMIFDSASMEDVPWELIVKEFRPYIKDKSFNELEGYAAELFAFVESNLQVFPLPYRETIFKNDVDAVIGMYLYEASHLDTVKNGQPDGNKRAALDDYFRNSRTQIDGLPVPAHFSEEVIEHAINSHKAILEAETIKSIELFNLTGLIDTSELVILAVKTLFKNNMIFKSKTGIVVAGYGDSEIFPGFCEYQYHGLMLDKLIHEHLQTIKIDVNRTCHIKPFSTKSMVDTFLMGISPDVYATVI